MRNLVNDPEGFVAEALAGFAAANPDVVTTVGKGIVRSTTSPAGEVAIIMGGGSGHFPAFAGWVGPGLGHGAACGGIFASPSDTQIVDVARAADNGGGLMFVPINYAGDILHFTAAAERLRAEGIDVRISVVADDIASGSPEQRDTRRGIAGAFLVMKMAGAAAARGASLDDVARIAGAANAATRSFGVALSGPTPPGSAHPLFEVPVGRIAIGLGIHGEPGLDETDMASADTIADILVDGLIAERPAEHGRRVAVLVNSLGSTTPDELHVVYRRVAERLEGAGMTPVAPVVAPLMTSLDMAGLSLSLAYLDDELEDLWLAPARTPVFARGWMEASSARKVTAGYEEAAIPRASEASRRTASAIQFALGRVVEALESEQGHLGDLDAVAGDGDHGTGMSRGARAALAAAELAASRGAGAGTTLSCAGAAWSDVGGGTSGALWGTGLSAAGEVLGDEDEPSPVAIVVAVRAFADAIAARGGAQPGDKTMMDAVLPFVATLSAGVAAGDEVAAAWDAAVASSRTAAESTAGFVARRGRSRIHGDRSLGTPDAGAVSFSVVVAAASAASPSL